MTSQKWNTAGCLTIIHPDKTHSGCNTLTSYCYSIENDWIVELMK